MAGRIARGDIRLKQFAPPDKKGRSCTYSHPSEVVVDEENGMKGLCAVNLHNAVTVPQHRLGRRVARLGSFRMNEICTALRFSPGCDAG